MAAPVIASVSADKQGNTLTGITFTYATDGPSGIADGDLLVAFVVSAAGDAGAVPNHGAPAGWTALVQPSETVSRKGRLSVFYKIAASEGVSATFTSDINSTASGMVAKMWRVTGHDGTTPIPQSGSQSDLLTPFDVVGVSTTVADSLVVYAAGFGSASVETTAWEAGVTERFDFGTDPGNAASLSAATKTQAAPGASGDFTATPSSTTNIAALSFAIAPQGAFLKAIAGTLTPVGALIRKPSLSRAGTITPAATLSRKVSRALSGVLTPAAALSRKFITTLSGTISPSGLVSAYRVSFVAVSGAISFTGDLARSVGKALSGSVTPSGDTSKRISLSFSGLVTPAGTLAKKVAKSLSGLITPIGSFVRKRILAERPNTDICITQDDVTIDVIGDDQLIDVIGERRC